MGIGGQIRAALMSEPRGQYFFITLIFALITTQTSAQDVKGGSTFSSSSSLATSSKGAGLGASKFRENISSVQRVQQQVNVIQDQQYQQQITNQREDTQTSVGSSSFESQQQVADAEPAIYGSVKGAAGTDFPAYTSIPSTKFSCDGVPFEPGMYADESTGCQVYHMCYQGRRESFLCGIGTVFNQAIMSCDFWHSVECSKSSRYYSLNSEFGRSSSEPAGAIGGLQQRKEFLSSQIVQETQPVSRPEAIQKMELLVNNIQQRVVAPPQQFKTSRFEESSLSSSGGKVSPPRQQRISVQVQKSSFNDASRSFPAASKTSARSHLGFNSQRTSSSLISPGRRVASLNEQRSQQFSSESAPVQTVAARETANEQQGVSSNLVVTNSGGVPPSASHEEPDAHGLTEMESSYKSDAAEKTNSLAGIKLKQQQVSNEQVWKPVFRSKTSGRKTITKPSQQLETATDSQAAAQSTSTITSEQPTASTAAPPNEEPTFSSESSAAGPSDPVSMPSVPTSSIPPTAQPTITTSPEAITERTSNDSEADPAVRSTPAADSASTGQASSDSPSATTTEQPSTTSAPNTTESTEPPLDTVTEQSLSTTTETTTAKASPPQLTTVTETAEDKPISEEPASETSVESKKKRKKKKKRRGSEHTSSNPNPETAQTMAPKSDASWVEYASG